MKSETEIRATFAMLEKLLKVTTDKPEAAQILYDTLDGILEPTLRPEVEIVAWRARLRELADQMAARVESDRKQPGDSLRAYGAMVMEADILAWALDDRAWPNYDLACQIIGKLKNALRRATVMNN